MAKKGFVHSTALLAVAGALVAMAPLAQASEASATTTQYTFTADAYGSSGTVGANSLGAGSDKSAYVILSCTSTPTTHTNSTSGISIPGVTTSGGAVTDTVASAHNVGTGTWSDTADSTVGSINALGGLIKASAITSHAQAAEAPGGATASGTASLASLTVGGHTMSSNPAPNTKINLAGIGTVTLNAQKSVRNASQALMQVDAMEIVLSVGNILHAPVGATIIIGQVFATVDGPVTGLLSGYSYGTSLTGNPNVNSGPSFVNYLNCTGTGGKTVTDQGGGVSSGPLTAGQITDTATGTDTPTQLSASTSSMVENAGITSVLSLTAIHVTASASVTSGTFADSGGLTISGLKVLGVTVPLPNVVPANFSVPLLGGTLILNRQVKSANGIVVNGVYLKMPNVGTVTIGWASAGAK
jgi:hypothetical protein